MGTVYLSLSMSLDGFITGPIPVLESPWVTAVNGCTSGWQGWRTSASAVTRSALTLRFSANCLAIKMLASRIRRRVQDAATVPDADLARQREVVAAFLAASRHGGFEALLAVLDPDIILRADRAAAQTGASREVRGAPAVADTFSRRARFTQPALVNGAAGAVWAPSGRPRVVFGFTLRRGRIIEIDLVADPRAPAPARPDDPRRLMLSAAHR